MTVAGFMVDISDPQTYNFTGTSVIPPEYKHLPRASAIYIGGNTPHVWTELQIDTQTNRYGIPIWVYNPSHPGAANGKADGQACLAKLHSLSVPKGVRVAYDMEDLVDKEWSQAFCETIEASGYLGTGYGSLSTIFDNHIGKGGAWTASWGDGVTPKIHLDQNAWATQYANSRMLKTLFDMSVLSDMTHLWDRNAPLPVPASDILLRMSYSKDGGKTWLDFSITPNTL